MKLSHIVLWVLIVMGTVLGVYGQSLAYFLEGISNTTDSLYYLTIMTIISISMCLVTPLIAFLMIKTKILDKKYTLLYIFSFGTVGIVVSMWSFIVCAMWWG
ncbi:hypothetical protein [Niallia taxi]|uniref:hypothetical protein n=1 Tax=Niallia taxi TaxID=2499688 RepID=UPI0011A56588|nr:hypothetical protein [Niallia taxi]MDE5054648.1 hypothetical protein [Niallia taxi]WOD65848.1 hypothetical protein NQZ71_21910 [Niallia taxi]